ncbi:MAG: MBL fold metallo-hydrolase [Oscillospiraceae bacterium]
MNFEILSTGSKGNAVFLPGGILVDCGVPFKRLVPVLRDIRLVLLTHIHGDHFNKATISRLANERPSVRFCCREWMVVNLVLAGVPLQNIDVLMEGEGNSYGKDTFSVESFTLFHDVPNCGWRIFYDETEANEKVFYATDTGTLDGVEAKNYSLYLIEANHTVAEIEARFADKASKGEFIYEERAAENHLSREQALDFLINNGGPDSEFVFLHQHEEVQHA